MRLFLLHLFAKIALLQQYFDQDGGNLLELLCNKIG